MTLEAVYHECAHQLTRRLERMVGSPEVAEDLRQEAFARAWRSAPPDMSAHHLRAWLYRTASNLAIDELRRRRWRDWSDVEELPGIGVDVDHVERLACSSRTRTTRGPTSAGSPPRALGPPGWRPDSSSRSC